MSIPKKRKIEEEHRGFKDRWTETYFCIQNGDKVSCLICNETIAVLKECNIRRHYDTKHKVDYEQFTGKLRTGNIRINFISTEAAETVQMFFGQGLSDLTVCAAPVVDIG